MSTTVDEDVIMESSSSQSGPGTPVAPSNPSTPMASNPGTPRSSSVVDSEYRNTPPPVSITPSSSSSQLAGSASQARGTPPPQQAGTQSGYISGASAPASITVAGAQKPAAAANAHQSKYTQLLAVIEDMGRDIRPTYSGSRTSVERLKRGIVHSRILVRECLMECERAART